MNAPFKIAPWLIGVAGLAVTIIGTATYKNAAYSWYALGIVPIIIYHARLHIQQTKTALPQAAIDTVYYLGFLITIATLGCTVVSIGIGKQALKLESLSNLAAIFGLGLFATGYALFARIMLMMQSERIDSESLDDKVERYAIEAERALAMMQRSAIEFESFSQQLRTSNERASQEALASSQNVIRVLTEQAKTNIGSALDVTRETLTDFSAQLEHLTPTVEIENLSQTVRNLGARLRALDAVVQKASTSAETFNSTCLELSNATTSLYAPLSNLRVQLNDVSDIGNVLNESVGRVNLLNREVAGLEAHFHTLGATLTDSHSAIYAAQGSLTQSLQIQADLSRGVSEALDRTTTVTQTELETRQILNSQYQALAAKVSQFASSVGQQESQLKDQVDNLGSHISGINQALNTLKAMLQEVARQQALRN
jgi:chromosome segregation ATPase